ncbi:MAG: glycosyl transferase family 1, partial [Methylotenera sp.]|nr:glycosyl transferase family 1 [Methylotenera sp.]
LVTESCGYAHHVAEAEAGLVNPLPFQQTAFNQQWLQMRSASESQRLAWASNGLSHTRHLMLANDGSAEANILIDLARGKMEKA